VATETQDKGKRAPFPPLYWLVVLFEFFERGSYYGMMSVLSVYMTGVLEFPKQDVGVIKATIQPLLYFLPIISGALADRFGYRRMLMVAFSLLGGGYLLTSQATAYKWVFLSLMVMGLGAGTFKPLISGAIARCTDESNSTLGFGIYYWSINLGAFLFPLILVPYLKNNVGWDWVIIASAIGTGSMLLPTLFVFREPPVAKEEPAKAKPSLLVTLARAFEIIYSPFVLLYHMLARRSPAGILLVGVLLAGCFGLGGWLFLRPQEATYRFSARAYGASGGRARLVVRVKRNVNAEAPFALEQDKATGDVQLTLHDPDRLQDHAGSVLNALHAHSTMGWVDREQLRRCAHEAARQSTLVLGVDRALAEPFALYPADGGHRLAVASPEAARDRLPEVLDRLRAHPDVAGLSRAELELQLDLLKQRPFLLPFVGLLLLASLIIFRLANRFRAASTGGKLGLLLGTVGAVEALLFALWGLGTLSLFAAILCGIIAATLAALFAIEHEEVPAFQDHFRFLLMIFIYSGFWVLYFQMFDSVLWYVEAYVDASSLNDAVNGVLGALGLSFRWRFDVEHVTVINAGTIILLQLVVSNIVKNTKALPTMVAGIGLGTLGMAVLAFSTGIWVFILGITIFSIGEMTAHPKFISYVGQSAPKSRVAMYMGYIFLYGVIGSSIGSMVGANLYVKFVDQLNQPRVLWIIFAGIGVATIIALLAYNAFTGKWERRAE